MSTLEVVKYIDWMTSVSHNKLELIFIFLGGGDTLCVFWQPCASKGYYIRSFCVIPFKFRVLQMYITIVGIYSNMDCGDHGTQDRCQCPSRACVPILTHFGFKVLPTIFKKISPCNEQHPMHEILIPPSSCSDLL